MSTTKTKWAISDLVTEATNAAKEVAALEEA